jgi:hypothetical protein
VDDASLQTLWMESPFAESDNPAVRASIAFGVKWSPEHYFEASDIYPDYRHCYSVVREDLTPFDGLTGERFVSLARAVDRATTGFANLCGALELAALNAQCDADDEAEDHSTPSP